MKHLHAYYEGKVQGVGFRASIMSLAKGYEVTGWVKNLPDGRVQLFLSGDDSEVDDFLQGVTESHLAGHIENVSVLPGSQEAGLRGFRIIST
jgi:acylphosphatase